MSMHGREATRRGRRAVAVCALGHGRIRAAHDALTVLAERHDVNAEAQHRNSFIEGLAEGFLRDVEDVPADQSYAVPGGGPAAVAMGLDELLTGFRRGA